jgi:hypothetical protein
MAKNAEGKAVRNHDLVVFIKDGEEKHGTVRRICGNILEVAVWDAVQCKHRIINIEATACTKERTTA